MNGSLFFAIIFAGFCFYITYKRMNKPDARTLLKKKEPTALLQAFVQDLKRIQNKSVREAFTVYNQGLALIIYGQIEEAKSTIQAVDWDHAEPLCQALHSSVQSVIHYFEGNIPEGLALARRARAIQTTAYSIKGVQIRESVLQAYVDIGELLDGYQIEDKILKLRADFNQLPILVQLVAAWALRQAYRESNQLDAYKGMEAFIRKNAPYCVTLLEDNIQLRVG